MKIEVNVMVNFRLRDRLHDVRIKRIIELDFIPQLGHNLTFKEEHHEVAYVVIEVETQFDNEQATKHVVWAEPQSFCYRLGNKIEEEDDDEDSELIFKTTAEMLDHLQHYTNDGWLIYLLDLNPSVLGDRLPRGEE